MKLVKNIHSTGFRVVSDEQAEAFLQKIEGRELGIAMGASDYALLRKDELKVIVQDITDTEAETITRLLGDTFAGGVVFCDFSKGRERIVL